MIFITATSFRCLVLIGEMPVERERERVSFFVCNTCNRFVGSSSYIFVLDFLSLSVWNSDHRARIEQSSLFLKKGGILAWGEKKRNSDVVSLSHETFFECW